MPPAFCRFFCSPLFSDFASSWRTLSPESRARAHHARRRAFLQIFPANNPWNQDISRLKVHPLSQKWLASVGLNKPLHPDFGLLWNGVAVGIPFVMPAEQKKVSVGPFLWPDESDSGPYPIPDNAPIEGGEQAKRTGHVIISTRTTKSSTRFTTHERLRMVGKLTRALSGTSRATSCGKKAGPAPTPRVCRSSPAWCATTRLRRRRRSATPCDSPWPGHSAATSCRRPTGRAGRMIPIFHRWARVCG